MNYGFNLAASGILTMMHRQNVASNNLANIETVGFKVDQTNTFERPAARQEDGLYDLPSNKLLERLGGGVFLAPTRTAFTQGALQATSNPLDVAIQGDGFLMVEAPAPPSSRSPGSATGGSTGSGGSGGVELRLTRDGRLTLDKNGRVVNATSGLPVLDPSQRQITLNPGGGRITIDRDGTIRQGAENAAVGRLALVDVSPADRMKLKKEGAGLFSAPAQVMNARREATGDLVQGSVERSNADPIQSMMQMTDASMAVATATRIAQIHDELMGRAIGTLGRVS